MGNFWLLLLTLLLLLLTQSSWCLDDKGKTQLRLESLFDDDAHVHLSNWDFGNKMSHNPCGWFGVACKNGKAISLMTGIMTNRKLLVEKVDGSRGFHTGASPTTPPNDEQGKPSKHSPASNMPPPDSTTYSPPIVNPSTPASQGGPIPGEETHPPSASRKTDVFLYSLIGVAAGLFSIIALVFLYQRYNKVIAVKPWATGLSGQLQKAFVTGVPVLKRQEIEIACEDFSNIIGSLGDCVMYKGTLSSGVEIAVTSAIIKTTKDWSSHAEAQFNQKIATLSRMNHKNFVNLLGYCTQEEPFTRMMVFEYAPNGTLYDHLHNKDLEGLNWSSRLRIAMGIAYCLDHMHQLSPPVILKSLDSNLIHLTDDYAAKIADLELWSETVSSNIETGDTHATSNPTLDRADIVHKYGLLLLEIISGKSQNAEAYGNLTEWTAGLHGGEISLKHMVDTDLESYNKEDVRKIADVIKSCLNPDPNARPTMKEIAGRLREITAVHPESAMPRLSPLWWAELEIISNEAN